MQWFNPRFGGELQYGSVYVIHNSGMQSIGLPPKDINEDWAVLVKKEPEGFDPVSIKALNSGLFMLNEPSKMVNVSFRLQDLSGNLSTSSQNPVSFSITGPGKLNGQNPVFPSNGIASISFNPSGDTGKVVITASSNGLQPDSIAISVSDKIYFDNFEFYNSDKDLQTYWEPISANNVNLDT